MLILFVGLSPFPTKDKFALSGFSQIDGELHLVYSAIQKNSREQSY
jgi:hypothetical protein